MENNSLIVARCLDGRVIKGTSIDFSAARPSFHLSREDGELVDLRLRDLKAVFFVKSLSGDSARESVHGFIASPPETQQGRKVAVRFHDGEFVCGYALSWSSEREGFFLFPADVGSNNLRIWIQTGATKEIKSGPSAELMAGQYLAERARLGLATTSMARSGASGPQVIPLHPPPRGSGPPRLGGNAA